MSSVALLGLGVFSGASAIGRFDVDSGELLTISPALSSDYQPSFSVHLAAGYYWVTLFPQPFVTGQDDHHWARISTDLGTWEYFSDPGRADADRIATPMYLGNVTTHATISDDGLIRYVADSGPSGHTGVVRVPTDGNPAHTGGITSWLTFDPAYPDDESFPEVFTLCVGGHFQYTSEGDYIWDVDVTTGLRSRVFDLGHVDTSDEDLAGFAKLPDGTWLGTAIAADLQSVAWSLKDGTWTNLGTYPSFVTNYDSPAATVADAAYVVTYIDHTGFSEPSLAKITSSSVEWQHSILNGSPLGLYDEVRDASWYAVIGGSAVARGALRQRQRGDTLAGAGAPRQRQHSPVGLRQGPGALR